MTASAALRGFGLALTLAGGLVSANGAQAQIQHDRVHEGSWFSFFVDTTEGGDGRAYVEAQGASNSLPALRIDFVAGHCQDAYYFAVQEEASRLPAPDESDKVRVQVRVDRQQIHAGDGTYGTATDSDVVMVNVVFDESRGLIEEMRKGQTVRVRLIGANDTWVAAYPLAGSNAALQRARSLCEEYGGDHEEYFEDAPDEDYFRDTAQ